MEREVAHAGHAGFDSAQHLVEDAGEAVEFVAATRQRDALREVSRVDSLGTRGERLDGPQRAAHEPRAAEHEHADGRQPVEQEHVRDLFAGRFLRQPALVFDDKFVVEQAAQEKQRAEEHPGIPEGEPRADAHGSARTA